jgi:peptidoglycan-associated lipoprotein
MTANHLKSLFFVVFLLVISACSAGKKSLKLGEKKYERGEFEFAIEAYEKAIKANHSTAYSNFMIGESYRVTNRLYLSLPHYEKAIAQGLKNEEAQLFLAQSLRDNQRYEEAEKVLIKLIEKTENIDLTALANRELDNLKVLNDIKDQIGYFEIKNVEELNTEEAEYSPVFHDGDMYFTSARDGGKIYKATGQAFTNIYKVDMEGAQVLPNTISKLPDIINTEGVHEGSVTFSRDGRTMVFARGNTGRRKGAEDVNLYISRFRNREWSEPVMLSISDPSSWDSTPAFSKDGKTLYFSSNREGGYGGTDIYAATVDGNGRWGKVRNLGPKINTPGNEMFPFVSDDGRLYFSSTGHAGYGGLDLFVAKNVKGELVVQNLGASINSNKDDFGINFINSFEGYFASNRDGGKGDDDIYYFYNNDPNIKIVNYVLAGRTLTRKENSEEEILGTVKVKLIDGTDKIVGQGTTGRSGRYSFKVEAGQNYYLIGEKDDYFVTRELFSTVGKTVPQDELTEQETTITFEQDLLLDRIVIDKAIVLENIYYDLDKWDIRQDAADELDKLVEFLRDNPDIKIELSSHTDDRNTDDYNMKLSQRRAEAAVNYIVSRGISRSRLVARGYGKNLLIIKNAQSEEEHQVNRRTEFRVLEYIKDGRS